MEFITTLRFFGDLNRLKQHNNNKKYNEPDNH